MSFLKFLSKMHQAEFSKGASNSNENCTQESQKAIDFIRLNCKLQLITMKSVWPTGSTPCLLMPGTHDLLVALGENFCITSEMRAFMVQDFDVRSGKNLSIDSICNENELNFRQLIGQNEEYASNLMKGVRIHVEDFLDKISNSEKNSQNQPESTSCKKLGSHFFKNILSICEPAVYKYLVEQRFSNLSPVKIAFITNN